MGGETRRIECSRLMVRCEEEPAVTESRAGVLGSVFKWPLCCCFRSKLERDRAMREERHLQAHLRTLLERVTQPCWEPGEQGYAIKFWIYFEDGAYGVLLRLDVEKY